MNSAFAIRIAEANMELPYEQNVERITEAELKFATTTRFQNASILPETEEYYSK